MIPFCPPVLLHSALALAHAVSLSTTLPYLGHWALDNLLTFAVCRIWRRPRRPLSWSVLLS
jgi:hypothetical protein